VTDEGARLLWWANEVEEAHTCGQDPDERWQRMQHPDLVPVAEKYWRSVLARFLAASPAEPDTALRERLAALADEYARAASWRETPEPGDDGDELVVARPLRTVEADLRSLLSAAPPEHHSHCASLHPGEVEGDPCDCRTLRMIDRHMAGQAPAHRGGADDTPVDRLAKPTPGQLIARILDADIDERLVMAERMLDNADTAARCFEMNHEHQVGELAELRSRFSAHMATAQQEIDQLRAQLSAAPPEREDPTPASVRAEALRRIEQREATPGNPADGPYPASVGEVADELAGLVVELDAGPAPRLVRELAARLTEREAPSRAEVINRVSLTVTPGGTFREIATGVVDDLIERDWLQVREGGQE
jgi:hypothetical protein